jgi:hypothetical protein
MHPGLVKLDHDFQDSNDHTAKMKSEPRLTLLFLRTPDVPIEA